MGRGGVRFEEELEDFETGAGSVFRNVLWVTNEAAQRSSRRALILGGGLRIRRRLGLFQLPNFSLTSLTLRGLAAAKDR
jgi:hypothetical protein